MKRKEDVIQTAQSIPVYHKDIRQRKKLKKQVRKNPPNKGREARKSDRSNSTCVCCVHWGSGWHSVQVLPLRQHLQQNNTWGWPSVSARSSSASITWSGSYLFKLHWRTWWQSKHLRLTSSTSDYVMSTKCSFFKVWKKTLTTPVHDLPATE